MSFLSPKMPAAPPPPPSAPTRADESVRAAGERQGSSMGYKSSISTSSTGLKRKANTQKRSLIGGA